MSPRVVSVGVNCGSMESVLLEIRDILKRLVTQDAVVADNFTCSGMTAKGRACTNKRIENSEYCGMHGGNKKRKASDTPTSSTKAKIIPSHDHGEDEVSSTCELCVQHGDALNPDVVKVDYSIEERLRNILQQD